jgi:LEA14-like dessication related protein
MKKLYILTILCIGFLLTNCNNSMSETPSFETIEDLRFTKFKKRKLRLEGTLVFKNPTSFDIELDAYGFDLYYNGKKVDNIQTKKDRKIKAGEEYRHTFISIVNSKEILPLISGKTWKDFDREEIEIEIKGEALAKYQMKTYTMDIGHHQTLELSKDNQNESDEDTKEDAAEE